jgi:hypothetical protein
MKNVLLPIASLLLVSSAARAVDWDAQAREDARQDRVVLAYDGIKPDSMVCDTTVRELADGLWMLLILAGDSREPSPKNYVGVARSADQGRTWSKLEPFDTGLPRAGDTIGQGPTELIVRDKEALLFFATHGDSYSWAKQWKSKTGGGCTSFSTTTAIRPCTSPPNCRHCREPPPVEPLSANAASRPWECNS